MYIRVFVSRAIPALEKLIEEINAELKIVEEKGRAQIVQAVHDINEETPKHILYRLGILKYKPIILTDEKLEERFKRRIEISKTYTLVKNENFEAFLKLQTRIEKLTERLEDFKIYHEKGIKSVLMTDNEFSFKNYYD